VVVSAQGYEAHGGLAVSWDTFGSSGHITRPPGGSLKSYWCDYEIDFVCWRLPNRRLCGMAAI
jgi:hypothetical protein